MKRRRTLLRGLSGPVRSSDAFRAGRSPSRRRLAIEGLEGRRLLAVGIAEFPAPSDDGTPGAIVAGPGGNLWFALGSQIGEVTPNGTVTIRPVPGRDPDIAVFPQELAAGP